MARLDLKGEPERPHRVPPNELLMQLLKETKTAMNKVVIMLSGLQEEVSGLRTDMQSAFNKTEAGLDASGRIEASIDTAVSAIERLCTVLGSDREGTDEGGS